jgi:TolA-binding protein
LTSSSTRENDDEISTEDIIQTGDASQSSYEDAHAICACCTHLQIQVENLQAQIENLEARIGVLSHSFSASAEVQSYLIDLIDAIERRQPLAQESQQATSQGGSLKSTYGYFMMCDEQEKQWIGRYVRSQNSNGTEMRKPVFRLATAWEIFLHGRWMHMNSAKGN